MPVTINPDTIPTLNIRKSVLRRVRRGRTAWTGALGAVFILGIALWMNPHSWTFNTAKTAVTSKAVVTSPAASQSQFARSEAPRQPPRDVPVTLTTTDGSVHLSWPSRPGQEYLVYRCTDPRMACAVTATVTGGEFQDTPPENAALLYYRVVPQKEVAKTNSNTLSPARGGSLHAVSSDTFKEVLR